MKIWACKVKVTSPWREICLPSIYKRVKREFSTYNLTGMLSRLSCGKLNKTKATWLIVVLDTHTSADNLAKFSKCVMEIAVFPVVAETFHKNIRLRSTVPKKILVVRKCTTNLAMQLWELYLVHQTTSLHDVRESTERIVKVLQNRST